MKAIPFPQMNLKLAEDQPEYDTLPVFVDYKEAIVQIPEHRRDDPKQMYETRQVAMSAVACFELTDEEVAQIVKTKKLWYRQMIFGNKFQPMNIFVDNPLIQQGE